MIVAVEEPVLSRCVWASVSIPSRQSFPGERNTTESELTCYHVLFVHDTIIRFL